MLLKNLHTSDASDLLMQLSVMQAHFLDYDVVAG